MTTSNRSYFYANGKRKTSRATIRLFPSGSGDVSINETPLLSWADTEEMVYTVLRPLEILAEKKNVDLMIRVSGGGKRAQADAIALGISRVLVKKDMNSRTQLKEHGLLTRDSREKERKKPGLKRARRAPQWAKR